jgi:hypothetical protein
MKLKLIAAAAAMVVAGSANAAIGAVAGNGELFFSIWDGASSYTRALTLLPTGTTPAANPAVVNTISVFETAVGQSGFSEVFSADAALTTFLAGASNKAALQWSIVAADGSGENRLLTTYTLGTNFAALTPAIDTQGVGSAVAASRGFVSAVNTPMGTAKSVTVASTANDPLNGTSGGYAGSGFFGNTVGGNLNFSNTGVLSNNSFATGLGFLRINDGSVLGTAPTFTQYLAGGNQVRAWVDASGNLTIAAVPEPETFAMLIAGLGVMGALARRRRMSV